MRRYHVNSCVTLGELRHCPLSCLLVGLQLVVFPPFLEVVAIQLYMSPSFFKGCTAAICVTYRCFAKWLGYGCLRYYLFGKCRLQMSVSLPFGKLLGLSADSVKLFVSRGFHLVFSKHGVQADTSGGRGGGGSVVPCLMLFDHSWRISVETEPSGGGRL